MEQIRTAPKGDSFTQGQTAPSSYKLLKDKNPNQNINIQQIIHDEAIEIACDWLEATGRPITKDEFDNLFSAGFASHSSTEVEEIFYGWEDYQAVSETYYVTPTEKAQKEWELVESLYQEAQAGLIPVELFLKSEQYSVENPNNPKRRLQRHRLTGEYAPSDIVLEGYHKYVLVNHLIQLRPSEQVASEERKLSIAAGFTLSTGKPLSTLIGGLKNSYKDITEGEIRRTADELGVYDYIFPKSRQEHLNALVQAAQKPEYFFDTLNRKIIMVGRIALQSSGPALEGDYLTWLNTHNQLLQFKDPRKIAKGIKQGSIVSLSELLTSQETKIDRQSDKLGKYNDFSKGEYLSYGHFIINLTGGVNRALTKRGRDLGIGPGPWMIIKNFGSMPNYYKELGVYYKQDFGKWTPDLIEEYIQAVYKQRGEVNISLIDVLHKQSPHDRPSSNVVQRVYPGGLTNVLESLALPGPPTKRKNVNQLLTEAIILAETLGRVPKSKELAEIASTSVFQKHFGSISAVQTEIRKHAINKDYGLAD